MNAMQYKLILITLLQVERKFDVIKFQYMNYLKAVQISLADGLCIQNFHKKNSPTLKKHE